MNAFQSYAFGERPRSAVAVVTAVAVVSTVMLGLLGALGIGTSGGAGVTVFAFIFGVLPATAGAFSGGTKLGYPAATVVGLVPGVVFYLVVAVGATLGIGGFGGGDSPLWALSMLFVTLGVVWATAGFVVGVVAAVVVNSRRG